MSFNIAIDGPAGAGKSTIAKQAASRLGFIYVDTGAMYRAIALYLLRNEVDPEDEEALKQALKEIKIELKYLDNAQRIILNGEDVSGLIRTEQVSEMASLSSSKAIVRRALLSLQRDIAASNDVIMDGRDIGTVILPDADLKIYLTASVEARARRRFKEDQEKGFSYTLDEIKRDIQSRDQRDMNREVSPLKKADDAVEIDSSDMTIEEVLAEILRLKEERS